MTVTELSRAQWGAGPLGAGHVVPLAQFVGLVVHHTVIVMPDYDHDGMLAGDLEDAIVYMRVLQHARPDLGADVPYSFVVFEGAGENDCIVAEGRGVGVTGAHTIGYNSTRYGVAFAGDFTAHAPTPGMWAGVAHVGRRLADPSGAERTLEHRDVYATECPGNATPSPALAQPPFTDPSPQEDELVFIIEFLDWPGALWLCQPDIHTPNSYGLRRHIPTVDHLNELVAHGVKVIAGRQPGGNLYTEVK